MSLLDFNIVWDVLNFLVLMYLLHRFLYKPVVGMMEERRQKIRSDIDYARRDREEADALRHKYEEKLAQVEAEGRNITEAAYQRARQKEEEIIARAREEAKREQERARREIARAQAEARSQLRDEVVSLSLLAAGRYLQENLSPKEHYALMEKVVEGLPQKLGESR